MSAPICDVCGKPAKSLLCVRGYMGAIQPCPNTLCPAHRRALDDSRTLQRADNSPTPTLSIASPLPYAVEEASAIYAKWVDSTGAFGLRSQTGKLIKQLLKLRAAPDLTLEQFRAFGDAKADGMRLKRETIRAHGGWSLAVERVRHERARVAMATAMALCDATPAIVDWRPTHAIAEDAYAMGAGRVG